MRAWREANKEHVAGSFAQWQERNKGRRLEYRRELYKTNAALRLSVREANKRRKARLRGATHIERVDLVRIYEAFHGQCGICHDPKPINWTDLHFDHIRPLARGGQHTAENLQPAHAVCNLRKCARLPEEMAG